MISRYVFCTKNESGGLYFRAVFNRFLVAAFISNVVVALAVAARTKDYVMLGALAPLPFLLLGFKFFCKRSFDNSIKYYTKGETPKGVEAPPPIDKEARRRDRVAVRFGHPALYQKLTVPMVNEKSKHMLSEVYRGRLDGDIGGTAGYSDMYSMKRMSKEHPGKAATTATGPFEFVSENNMDYENFKNRPEFSDGHGGDGSIYGNNNSRPSSPSTVMGANERGRSVSRDSERTMAHDDGGVTYPTGYHTTPSNLREYSPSPERNEYGHVESNRLQQIPSHDDTNLLGQAAPMGQQTPNHQAFTPYSPERDGIRRDYFPG